MEKIDKKIKDLKEFIKQKTDQGTANYLGKEIREICGMVETEQSSITAVVQVKPEKVCICNQITKSGGSGFCPKCNTDWL